MDAQNREILQQELLRIHGQTGKTILFVTHDLDEAIYLSDRIIVLGAKPGRIKRVIECRSRVRATSCRACAAIRDSRKCAPRCGI